MRKPSVAIVFALAAFLGPLAARAIPVAVACPTCSGSVLVDQSVVANFNTNPPSCSGDADLCAFFTFNNSGPTPDTWFAIFDIGSNALLVNSGATITTSSVGSGNNLYSPGIQIATTCSVNVAAGGAIAVQSMNRKAGDILIRSNGQVAIDGTVSNTEDGTKGLPGNITIATCCGDIATGPGSVIQTVGNGPGGSDINLLACCQQGDISLSGLVMARSEGAGASPKPNIKIAAFAGSVTVSGDAVEPQLADFHLDGIKYDLFPGVLSWVSKNSPGGVSVQASASVSVFGHGDSPAHPGRPSFAAITAGTGKNDAPGGLVDVRSIHGLVAGTNRAFQSFGRAHAADAGSIRLSAGGNIELSRTGSNASFNPVVDSQASQFAGSGGINELRSFNGDIFIDSAALVSAAGKIPGSNLLTSCLGVIKLGAVNPADADATDDSAVCSPTSTPPIFTDCSGFGITFAPPDDGPNAILFLNRFGGTYRQGFNSAITNTSSLITGTRTIPPFAGTDADWNNILTCVREEYAPFDVSVVDVEPPPTVRYTEAVVGGLPSNAGFESGTVGISPLYCSPAVNTIVFIFSDHPFLIHNDRLICEVIAHEVGHSFALDHEFLCEDPMTYLEGCGEKTFQDQTVACGEFSERQCVCGSPTQNSFESLLGAIGPSFGSTRPLRPLAQREAEEPVGVCVLPVPEKR